MYASDIGANSDVVLPRNSARHCGVAYRGMLHFRSSCLEMLWKNLHRTIMYMYMVNLFNLCTCAFCLFVVYIGSFSCRIVMIMFNNDHWGSVSVNFDIITFIIY